MKNFTIALFAIMMIAGFAMANETADVDVDVTVQQHATMVVTIPLNDPADPLLLEYVLAGGIATQTLGFNVYAEANYAGVGLTFGFTPAGAEDWTGLTTSFDAVSNPVTPGVGGENFPKTFTVSSTLDAVADSYNGNILVTLVE